MQSVFNSEESRPYFDTCQSCVIAKHLNEVPMTFVTECASTWGDDSLG